MDKDKLSFDDVLGELQVRLQPCQRRVCFDVPSDRFLCQRWGRRCRWTSGTCSTTTSLSSSSSRSLERPRPQLKRCRGRSPSRSRGSRCRIKTSNSRHKMRHPASGLGFTQWTQRERPAHIYCARLHLVCEDAPSVTNEYGRLCSSAPLGTIRGDRESVSELGEWARGWLERGCIARLCLWHAQCIRELETRGSCQSE